MIELRHRRTGAVLFHAGAGGLAGSGLYGRDLRGAELKGAELAGANLAHTLLAGADLRGADLAGADLSRAYLPGTNLRGANLREARLAGASLDGANCTGANLIRADLTGAFLAGARLARANLTYANFHGAHLGEADLTGARLAFTVFAACRGLHEVAGLAEVEHLGPSSLDLQTLREALPHLPVAFLRGAGLYTDEIRGLKSKNGGPQARRACFLCHVDADAAFARRLRDDLRDRDVSCWRLRRDLGGGYFVQVLANRAALRSEPLILVCSRQSVLGGDLAADAVPAIEREREAGRPMIFALRLDDLILSERALRLADERMAAGEWREDWVRHIRVHPIHDFRNWRNPAAYRSELRRLLRALENPAPRPARPGRIPTFPH